MTMLLGANDRAVALNLPPLTSDVLPSILRSSRNHGGFLWGRSELEFTLPVEIMGDFRPG
jgi:hypothetical protein